MVIYENFRGYFQKRQKIVFINRCLSLENQDKQRSANYTAVDYNLRDIKRITGSLTPNLKCYSACRSACIVYKH